MYKATNYKDFKKIIDLRNNPINNLRNDKTLYEETQK